jgi:hypothetical protein
LRHSFASLPLAEGKQPIWCAKQLGHTLAVFLSTYAHLIDEPKIASGSTPTPRSQRHDATSVRVWYARRPNKGASRDRSATKSLQIE